MSRERDDEVVKAVCGAYRWVEVLAKKRVPIIDRDSRISFHDFKSGFLDDPSRPNSLNPKLQLHRDVCGLHFGARVEGAAPAIVVAAVLGGDLEDAHLCKAQVSKAGI